MKKTKTPKPQKTKLPMSLLKKSLLYILAAALLGAVIYFIFYVFRYMLEDDYEALLSSYDVPVSTAWSPLTDTAPAIDGFSLAAENEYLKLYTEVDTANVAVYDKRNGAIFYTNPPDADEDKIANNVNINYLKSQMIVTYFNRMVRTGIYDSYSFAVEKGQFEIESLADGLRYRYRVGELPQRSAGIVPIYLSEEQLADLADKLGEDEGPSFARRYIPSDEAPGILELNTPTQNNRRQLMQMEGLLEEIGWTEEDYIEAMEKVGPLAEAMIPISFDIALDYRLEEDGLLVSIPVSEIESYGGGSIYSIQLLRYMGAAGMDESGYFVVPNGSGSIIHFNNGKQHYPSYQQAVYGIDQLVASMVQLENTENVKLPLFGICRADNTILATIEGGRTLSSITAAVSGAFNEYNYAYNTFSIGSADNLYNFGTTALDVYVREPDIYDTNLSIRYSFLTEDKTGYAQLANYYRDRLIREGELKPAGTVAQASAPIDIPFYYDVVGAVKETGHFLGVQYHRILPMTTYLEAQLMAEELRAAGINTQVMNFQGWFNGGYYQNSIEKIKPLRKLGSKRELNTLSRDMQIGGGRFYADVVAQKVTWADKSFNYRAEASRYFGPGFVAGFGQTHPTMMWTTASLGYVETLYNYISPRYLPRYVGKFIKKLEQYDIEGIALRDLGDNLCSDKKRSRIINREQTLDIILAQYDLLAQTDKKLMASAAFDYSFPYLDDIINVPLGSNGFFIIDADIPLYEMIIHGSINYAGNLLNFNDNEDKTDIVLRMIEYGASPHYAFTWAEANKMKYTGLSHYYNSSFAVVKHEAADIYGQVNAALKYVNGALMIDHVTMGDVRAVTYDNGVTIYVNYGHADVTLDGVTIPARGWSM